MAYFCSATNALKCGASWPIITPLLRVGVMWEKSVAQAQAAKKLSDELLGEEVQTWIDKS